MLTTALTNAATYLIFSQPAFDLLWEKSQIQYGILTGSITGIFVGAFQWLILRKYISDWKWIVIVGVSTSFGSTVSILRDILRESLSSRTNELSTQEVVLFIAVLAIGFLTMYIYGYLQWYILRPYVHHARWWIFLPFIANILTVCLSSLAFLTRGLLQLDIGIINLTMLPTTQAIGFCLLNKKSARENSILQSPLASSADIVNYWEVKKLEKILYKSIARIWKTDLRMSIGKLKYLVGVNHDGTTIVYDSMSQTAKNNIAQTPLADLARDYNHAALENDYSTELAKFQVVFVPPGSVEIYSWRGIPIVWLGVAVYTLVISISFLFTRL